jgi:hypothetical protein
MSANPYLRLSDKRRTEILLPAHILLTVTLAGAEVRTPPKWFPVAFLRKSYQTMARARRRFRLVTSADLLERRRLPYRQKSYATFLECRRLLEDTNLAVTHDLLTDKRLQITRRVERLHMEIVKPYLATDDRRGSKVAKFGLVAFYLLQILVDEQWVVVPEDSDLQKALDLLLPGLEHIAAIEDVDRSAQKRARQAFQLLQKRGYYVG